MLLCLDAGNSQLFGGVYDGEDLKATFRRTSSIRGSSDEFATFFRAVFRENGVDPEDIETLEDVVVAAVNEALSKAQKVAADKVAPLTGGMKLPGMP